MYIAGLTILTRIQEVLDLASSNKKNPYHLLNNNQQTFLKLKASEEINYFGKHLEQYCGSINRPNIIRTVHVQKLYSFN